MKRSFGSVLVLISLLGVAACEGDERESDVDDVGAAHGTPAPATAPADTGHAGHGTAPDTTAAHPPTTTTGH